ncbi:MAG: MBL fold metallo-hydrolase [Chloroflexota bacterium]
MASTTTPTTSSRPWKQLKKRTPRPRPDPETVRRIVWGSLCVAWLLGACSTAPAATPTATAAMTATATGPPAATAPPQAATPPAATEPLPTTVPLTIAPTATRAPEEEPTMSIQAQDTFTITIVYDNNAYAPGLTTDWGFAAVVAHDGHTLLFDTGGQGPILLDNMRALGIDPQKLEHVVLSHAHGDHTGGLHDLLATGIHPDVHVPPSFSASFKEAVADQTRVVETTPAMQVMEDVFVTGELPGSVPEQGLVLKSDRGLVVITGCAHPGVDRMVARARELFDDPIYLVLGGFHLKSADAAEVTRILGDLRQMGVQKVAPCHCTGDEASALFREAYGEDCIQAGVGKEVVIAPPQP